MKTIHLTKAALCLALFSFLFSSCSSDKHNDPLRVRTAHYDQNDWIKDNSLTLYYGIMDVLHITGGDGNYTYSLNSDLLTFEKPYDYKIKYDYLCLYPQGIGKVQFTISDGSGEVIPLNIDIAYYEWTFTVKDIEVRIEGDASLSESAQEEIKHKALQEVAPFKKGGGFTMSFTEGGNIISGEDLSEVNGTLYLYPEEVGKDAIEGTFTRITHLANGYTLHLNYNTQSSAYRLGGDEDYTKLVQDLTDIFKTDYPAVEKVTLVIAHHWAQSESSK